MATVIPVLATDHYPEASYKVLGTVVVTTKITSARIFDPFDPCQRPPEAGQQPRTRPVIWFDANGYSKLNHPNLISEGAFQVMLKQDQEYGEFLNRRKESAVNEIIEHSMEYLAQKAVQKGAQAVISWRYEFQQLDLGANYPDFGSQTLPVHEHNEAIIEFISTNLDQFFIISTGTMISFI